MSVTGMDFFRTLVTHPHATQYYQAEDQRPCEYLLNYNTQFLILTRTSHSLTAQ